MEEAEEAIKSPLEKQLMVIRCALLGPSLAGLLTIVLEAKRDLFEVEISWTTLNYAPWLAELTGVLTGTFFMYYYGRRRAVIFSNASFLITIAIFLWDLRVKYTYIAVLIMYFTKRHQLVSMGVYIAEMVEPRARPFFIGMFYLSYSAGILFGSFFLSELKLLYMFGVAINMFALIWSMQSPETPYYLAVSKQGNQAEILYTELRGEAGDANELDAMLDRAEADGERKFGANISRIAKRTFYLPLLLVFLMYVAETSVCSLYYWATNDLFETRGQRFPDYNTPVLHITTFQTVMNGFGPFVGSLVFQGQSLLLGRRPLYLFSLLGTLAVFLLHMLSMSMKSWIYAGIYFCHAISYMGAKQVPMIFATEIFPSGLRDLGVGLSQLLQVTFHFSEVITTDIFSYEAFTLFRSIIIAVGLLLTFLFLPETNNLTLTDAEALGANVLVRVHIFQDVTDKEDS